MTWKPDLGKIRGYYKIGCTNQEIADLEGVNVRTIQRRLRDDPDFKFCAHQGMAVGKVGLRRKQMQVAMCGDTRMLIHLGKNVLGQSDKIDTTQTVVEDRDAIEMTEERLQQELEKIGITRKSDQLKDREVE